VGRGELLGMKAGKKLTLSVNPQILELFRLEFDGSISAMLNGIMLAYLERLGHEGLRQK